MRLGIMNLVLLVGIRTDTVCERSKEEKEASQKTRKSRSHKRQKTRLKTRKEEQDEHKHKSTDAAQQDTRQQALMEWSLVTLNRTPESEPEYYDVMPCRGLAHSHSSTSELPQVVQGYRKKSKIKNCLKGRKEK